MILYIVIIMMTSLYYSLCMYMHVGLQVEVGVVVTKEEVLVGKDTRATQTEVKDKTDNYSNLDVLPLTTIFNADCTSWIIS